ncbi:bifunctional diaminohydroxyphosphoribosylaminopyrimidine deaminase/5-amino-6-(5-phosphoribosylamino)uracil reductase RibD [Sediminihabitans luteus]|nr:bifunctional diaminohydroxyphosphoribosylaminopyrimidine deaminase/5-amino-6-(5-phosphoribosylamino)uracil reductase RibD [Sediminihabitans luteus]
MRRAFELAAERPVLGPNPRVGCVILAPVSAAAGTGPDAPRAVLAEGRNAGLGPHAEAVALADAARRGIDVRGATAVVSLEPCNHTGRTPPCSVALADAGVAEVVHSVADPHDVAAGGAAYLRGRGVTVVGGVRRREGEELLGAWWHAIRAGRPYVTLKTATSLDGRVAAPDGTSRWITGPDARAHAHGVRAGVDAIVVGTGTALTDDPSLTARTDHGLATDQPLRVVVGHRDVPAGARLRAHDGGELVPLRTHDPAEVLAALAAREVRHVLVEGGPTLATAFLAAGLVDEVHAYVAPVLLGAGAGAVGDLGVATIADAHRFTTSHVRRLGDDVLVVARAERPQEEES